MRLLIKLMIKTETNNNKILVNEISFKLEKIILTLFSRIKFGISSSVANFQKTAFIVLPNYRTKSLKKKKKKENYL